MSITIDFQARINHYLKAAVRQTAEHAIHILDTTYQWQYDSAWDGNQLQIQVFNGDTYGMVFDLAGRTIDASLLEQLHNEVAEWFTNIKNEANDA